MRPHIEPFKRLYAAGRITPGQLQERLADWKITQEEYNYITENETSQDNDLKTYYEMTQALINGGGADEQNN